MTDQQLEELVTRIGDEMLGRLGLSVPPSPPAAVACSCEAESPRAAFWPTGLSSRSLELNCRNTRQSAAAIGALCQQASTLKAGAVSVFPNYVTLAGRQLHGSAVNVIAAIGWPHGETSTAAKAIETELALGQGADEIELVVPAGALLAGEDDRIFGELKFIAEMTRRAGGKMTVVIETTGLGELRLIAAAALVRLAGADAVCAAAGLTSPGSADPVAVKLFRQVVGEDLRVKAIGIPSVSSALVLGAAGACRLAVDDFAIVSALAGTPDVR